MGYMKHDAIIVTTFDAGAASLALTRAQELTLPTTDITLGIADSQYTFVIVPDGSKEGWAESDKMDATRGQYLSWLNAQAYKDGSNILDFIAVRFGGDDDDITVGKG